MNHKIKMAMTSSTLKRLCLLSVVSFVLHAAVILVIGHYRNPILWENGAIADQMWMGNGFSFPHIAEQPEPTSWQAPGYPYLLYSSWKLFGKTTAAYLLISLLQAALVASMVFPVFRLTERWFGVRAGWISVLLTVFLPLYAWYPTRLVQASFAIALHPWCLWGWLQLDKPSKSILFAIVIGSMTGAAGLFQPTLLLVYAGLGFCLLVRACRKPETQHIAAILCAGLATACILAPWTIRNYNVHGRFVPIKNSFGKELWMGNNSYSTGTAYIRGGAEEVTLAHKPQAFLNRDGLSEMEVMSAMQTEAWHHIKSNPYDFLKRSSRKLIWFWTVAPENLVRSSQGGEALKYRAIYIIYWFAVLGLVIISGAVMRSWTTEYTLIFAWVVISYSAIYSVTHVGMARYRGEAEFIFLPAAAATLSHALTLVIGYCTSSPRKAMKGAPGCDSKQ